MDYIDTYSGKRIYPFEPDPKQVAIEDIAHALSNLCRFGGHSLDFYSIAEHSVCVSSLCDLETRLWGLLHDATEAYLGDVVRPVKQLPEMEAYRRAEERLMQVIAEKFNLPYPMPTQVKDVDRVMLKTEKAQLLANPDLDKDDIQLSSIKVQRLSPKMAKELFLKTFHEIES